MTLSSTFDLIMILFPKTQPQYSQMLIHINLHTHCKYGCVFDSVEAFYKDLDTIARHSPHGVCLF